MGINGAFKAWDFDTGLLNFVLLTSMGGGAAMATLALARRGQRTLPREEEPAQLERR